MAKTYAPITNPKGIGKCSALLENRMQCWRAADVDCTETTLSTDAEGNPVEKLTIIQFCRAHAYQQQQLDSQLATAETNLQEAEAAVTNAEAGNATDESGSTGTASETA